MDHPPLGQLPVPVIEVLGTPVEAPATADMQLSTVEEHNAPADAPIPTCTLTYYSNVQATKRKLSEEQLRIELVQRGLQVEADEERWSGDTAKSKLAQKVVEHDKQACWGGFIGWNQQCGKPGGEKCRAKKYCNTCLEALYVPKDRVQIVPRELTKDGGEYANNVGGGGIWSTYKSSGRKFRSFNTYQECKRSDISIVVWESSAGPAPAPDAASTSDSIPVAAIRDEATGNPIASATAPPADSTAATAVVAVPATAAPASLPKEWLEEHGEEDAKQTCVVLKYVSGSRDFEPKVIADEAKRPAPASARTATKKPRTKRVRAEEAEEAEDEDDSSEEMELGDGQPAAAPPAAAVDAAEHKGREFLRALREVGGASGQSARLTSSCNMMITMVEAGLAEIRRSQMDAAEADEQDEAAAGTSEAQFRSLSADDDEEEGEPPASNPAPTFRALSVDDDAEDMAAVGPLARSLGEEDEEETVERVPPCTSPVEEEELAQSLPPPLQRLHEEYRALSRAVFAA